MRILIIAGGDSGERAVSLRSGAAVQIALRQAGHRVDVRDPAEQPLTAALAERYDAAFPIIHGQGGEDGSLQEQLEAIGLPYVGSGIEACRLTFDKAEYKRLLIHADIPVPEGALVNKRNLADHPLTKTPFVLKPNDGGSSVDTFIVRQPSKAPRDDMLRALTETYDEMLLEELIAGTELTVGVLDEQALPVIEIVPPADGEFDYENKYNGATQEFCPPQHIDTAVQQTAQDLAVRIHRLCDCTGMSRTDMIVTSDNRLIVLETNTLPGMTDQSLFPKAARVAGFSMPELCDKLVRLATD